MYTNFDQTCTIFDLPGNLRQSVVGTSVIPIRGPTGGPQGRGPFRGAPSGGHFYCKIHYPRAPPEGGPRRMYAYVFSSPFSSPFSTRWGHLPRAAAAHFSCGYATPAASSHWRAPTRERKEGNGTKRRKRRDNGEN